MQHMRDHQNFTPSKRAFQTQFKRWGFPSKRKPAFRDEDLVDRVKELWENNLTQRNMLAVLHSEGHEIKERELMKLRAKNRWLMRIPNGAKPTAADEEEASFEVQLLEAAQTESALEGALEGTPTQPTTTAPPVDDPPQSLSSDRRIVLHDSKQSVMRDGPLRSVDVELKVMLVFLPTLKDLPSLPVRDNTRRK